MMNLNNGMGDIGQLLTSMQDDIRAVKDQLNALPIFPKGTPSPHQ